VTSTPWAGTDGERIQAHSGMLFHDEAGSGWVMIGNSDAVQRVGGGQNDEVVIYRSQELYGPWGPAAVLVTVAQLNAIPGVASAVNTTIGIVERPKLHYKDGYYYIFLHLEPGHGEGYTLQCLGLFRFKSLEPPSASNTWEVVFVGRPGHNELTGQGFRVLDFGLFYDTVSGEVLYTATTDSYRFPGECCEGDAPGTCNYTKTNFCANTALVTFVVNLDVSPVTFTPLTTLPGRFEAPTLFRDPEDDNTLYMMASGQDGFGPNPVGLWSAPLKKDLAVVGSRVSDGWKWPAPVLWECLGLPHSGSGNAFTTQPFQVLPNPYSPAHGIYFGDNWLHGPGKESSGVCSSPAWHGEANCEPWQGNCPCNFPNSKCPGTSSPGFTAGYVWLPFTWSKLKADPEYLICAQAEWDMKAPPSDADVCYTYNVFPSTPYTAGLPARTDYRGEPVPYVESSCGFIPCPGWPMSKAENEDNTTACCEKVGDAITQGRNAGRCRAPDLCLGMCKENEHKNIPGGHGGCTFSAFDLKKAKVINGGFDCTTIRGSANSSSYGGVIDPCRGEHTIPK